MKGGKRVLSESGKIFAREFRAIMESDQIAKRDAGWVLGLSERRGL